VAQKQRNGNEAMRKLNRAFTLIELLVVIAIIAILAAILFPVFAQAKASAKTTATLSNVKQIALAGMMYSNDYDDVVHPHQFYDGASTPVIDAGFYWYIEPYVKSKQMLFDAARGIPVDTTDTSYLWSKAVSITLNRNGWSSWETLDTFVRSISQF
jgi:prepilin-type N-terminal cleavage/methylation domain-containing protein